MPGVVTITNSAFVARFHIKPEKRDEFMSIFDPLWRGALEFMNEQCNFVFYGWDRSDSWFYTIESYKDEQMLDGLRESEVFQDTVRTLLSLCDAPMEFQLLRGMDDDKSIFDKYAAGPSQFHPTAGDIGVVIS